MTLFDMIWIVRYFTCELNIVHITLKLGAISNVIMRENYFV